MNAPAAVPIAPTIAAFISEYSFLSNFHPCQIEYAGLAFHSSEAAYQAMKCLDSADRARFCPMSAAQAKRAGALVKVRPDWNRIRVDVMSGVVHAKFTQSKELRRKLLDTVGSVLVEGNIWGDEFWGVSHGRGQNTLGKILMCEREYWHLWGAINDLGAIPYEAECGQMVGR